MEKLIVTAFVVIVAVLASGCAGMEVGGKVGIYKVDDRDVRETNRSRSVPLICLIKNCNEAAPMEASGS